jgi:hypothetical protein
MTAKIFVEHIFILPEYDTLSMLSIKKLLSYQYFNKFVFLSIRFSASLCYSTDHLFSLVYKIFITEIFLEFFPLNFEVNNSFTTNDEKFIV